MSVRLELISTGEELLQGRTLNLHPRIITEKLERRGLKLCRVVTVGDDETQISQAVSSALESADVVVVGGGLGPTDDDVTREGVARALGRQLVLDGELAKRLREKVAGRGHATPPLLDRQAMVIEGAAVLDNRVGVAPGQRVEVGEKVIFILPGPPAEFEAVLEDHVVGWLVKRFRVPVRVEKVLMTCGMPEVELAQKLKQAGLPLPGCRVAFRAAPGRVEVAFQSGEDDAERLEDCVALARQCLGDVIFAEERAELAEVVGRLLRQRKQTLAVAESCTGGLLGGSITEVSGSSDYFVGGVIAYSNEMKIRQLGVPREVLEKHGAVSEPTVRCMAEGVRKLTGADIGVGVTGIAGPTGGTPSKPVGLVWFGVADAAGTVAVRREFGNGRERVRRWSVNTALDLIRRRVSGLPIR